MRARVLVPLLLVVGCAFPEPPGAGDPPPERPRPDGRPDRPASGPGPEGPGGPGGPGRPEGPDADGAEAPPPVLDGAMQCEGTPNNEARDGGSASLSGEVVFSEPVTQPVLIDLVDPRTHEQLWGQYCRGSGTFSFDAPKSLGEVVLVAFMDEDGDGPSVTDPQGRSKGTLDLSTDVTGLVITMERGAKVDVFEPPERLPEGEPPEGEGPDAGAPPPDADPPPEGPEGEPGEPVSSDGPQLQGQ